MAIHANHDAELVDGCLGCDEDSQHPFDLLDDTSLLVLVERVRGELLARTLNESRAMYHVRVNLRAQERLLGLGISHDGCSDDSCPCWEAGFEAAVQNVGEWHRPLGY